MSFDMTVISEMAMPVVVAASIMIGYILKKWLNDTDNKWIPTILAVCGAALGCVVTGEITAEVIISGAFSGLAGTGLHQAFKQLIESE